MSLATQIGIAKHRLSALEEDWVRFVRDSVYSDTLNGIKNNLYSIDNLELRDFWSKDSQSRRRVVDYFCKSNPLLFEIVKMCSSVESGKFKKSNRIGAILTTNVDCLFQLCDRAYHGTPRILRTVERSTAEIDADKISLYHLHGYLQWKKPLPGHDASDHLVLTDDEYLKRNDNPYSWASVVLHWAIREFPMVFIGCSMSDELVRRALRRLAVEQIKDLQAARNGREFRETRWRRHFAVARWTGDKDVDAAKNYSLGLLGVWPLWVKDFKQDLIRRVKKLEFELEVV